MLCYVMCRYLGCALGPSCGKPQVPSPVDTVATLKQNNYVSTGFEWKVLASYRLPKLVTASVSAMQEPSGSLTAKWPSTAISYVTAKISPRYSAVSRTITHEC